MDKEAGKRLAAEEAAKHIERGMTLGLGTGSTAAYFVDIVGKLVSQGWDLRGVPTSEATREHAERLGVEIIEPDETTVIDLAVDGADEADPALNLIKGGGAALLREKIIAHAAKKFIVIADKTKRVAAYARAVSGEVETIAHSVGVAEPRLMRRRHVRVVMDDGTSKQMNELYPSVHLGLEGMAKARGHKMFEQALERMGGS